MGAGSIESKLRARILIVVAPAVALVAIASVAATAWSLHRADDETAQGRVVASLQALRAEDAERDAPTVAENEVMEEAKAEHVRLAVKRRGADSFRPADGQGLLLSSLADGACATIVEGASTWRACAASDDRRSVIAAIDVSGRAPLLRRLSLLVAFFALAVLFATWLSIARAVRGTTSSLRALVDWSSRLVDGSLARSGQPGDARQAPPSSDTTEIDRLSAAFDAVVQRLLDALQRESATAAHVAHELRTPLTAIAGELESMRAGDAPTTEAIARARRDVDHLARMIDAILYLSRPATDDDKRTGVVNVADVVRELGSKETKVRAPDEALVESDAALVALAVRNLLDNARKHAGKPAIDVAVEREGERVRITVLDDGPGADEATRARMFDRYFRGSSTSAGSGLGLALVRAVARRHGGEASADEGPNGKGLAVSITLGPLVGWYEKEAPSSAQPG